MNTNNCLSVWAPIIISLLNKRLESCKKNLQDNATRVIFANDYCIEYSQENGIHKHYSKIAAEAMETAIKKFKTGNYELSDMEVLQTIKALFWCDECNTRLEGYSFDDLYSLLLEMLTNK